MQPISFDLTVTNKNWTSSEVGIKSYLDYNNNVKNIPFESNQILIILIVFIYINIDINSISI